MGRFTPLFIPILRLPLLLRFLHKGGNFRRVFAVFGVGEARVERFGVVPL